MYFISLLVCWITHPTHASTHTHQIVVHWGHIPSYEPPRWVILLFCVVIMTNSFEPSLCVVFVSAVQWSSTAVLHVQANGIGGAFFWVSSACVWNGTWITICCTSLSTLESILNGPSKSPSCPENWGSLAGGLATRGALDDWQQFPGRTRPLGVTVGSSVGSAFTWHT